METLSLSTVGFAITVNLPENEDPSLLINVTFLVSSLRLERPLLGFNVLQELVQGTPETQTYPHDPTLWGHLCPD